MSNQYEEEHDRKCSACSETGKGHTTKYIDENCISELFVCECGHQEVL